MVEVRAGKSGRLNMNPSEINGCTIAESDPLQNNSDVLELIAFVSLILKNEATLQDRQGQSGQMYPYVLVSYETVVTQYAFLILSYELCIANRNLA